MIPARLRPLAVFVAFACWGCASAYAQQQDGIESALGGGLDTPTRYHLEDALVRIGRILDPSP